MAGNISMGARREVVLAVAERYRSAGQAEKGRLLHELTAVTGWHRKHAVRALRAKPPPQAAETVPRKRRYNAAIRDAVTALWLRSCVRQAAQGARADAVGECMRPSIGCWST